MTKKFLPTFCQIISSFVCPLGFARLLDLQGRTQRGFEGGSPNPAGGLGGGGAVSPQRGPGRSPGRFWN